MTKLPPSIQFQIDKGQDVVILEVIQKSNGCYDGKLRFGSQTDPGEPSEIFSLGNLQTTQGFIANFREVETRVRQCVTNRLQIQGNTKGSQYARTTCYKNSNSSDRCSAPISSRQRGSNRTHCALKSPSGIGSTKSVITSKS